MDSWIFILQAIIQYCFVVQIVPALALGSSFVGPVSFQHTFIIVLFVFLQVLPYFLALQVPL